MIVKPHADGAQQFGEGAGRRDVRFAGAAVAGLVAVMDDNAEAAQGEQVGHDMGEVDCQRVLIADRSDALDEPALHVIGVQRAKRARGWPYEGARMQGAGPGAWCGLDTDAVRQQVHPAPFPSQAGKRATLASNPEVILPRLLSLARQREAG